MTSSRLRIISNNATPSPVAIPQIKAPYLGRVALVTLGCAKNQVDSEVMVGVLASRGYDIVDDVEQADIAIVNTCGFLQSAVEEGIDTILDISDLKNQRLKKLIVAGCMVERYGDDLKESMPEVDHFITTQDLLKIAKSAEGEFSSILDSGARPYFLYDDTMPRYLAGDAISAYVKISEGCNRPCAFCIIPRIRGSLRSRQPQSVIDEINLLSNEGIREANLVAQDLTAYGSDLNPKVTFLKLLERIGNEVNIPWVRLFYAYPLGISKELLLHIVQNPRVVNYLDLPFQHVSDHILASMKRPRGKYSPKQLAETIRTVAPELALRTTLIVGYPGETEDDIREIEQFIRNVSFEHLGIFEYSAESGTPAAELPGQIPEEEKSRRREHLMTVQQEVIAEKLKSKIGTREIVLIEGPHPESDLFISARASWQGPEVDGCIMINDFNLIEKNGELEQEENNIQKGDFALVEYTEVAGYDLIGTVLGSDNNIEKFEYQGDLSSNVRLL
jgi:ribosomal protein S12 methylthiotransferase